MILFYDKIFARSLSSPKAEETNDFGKPLAKRKELENNG
jgi:hypothetical protein